MGLSTEHEAPQLPALAVPPRLDPETAALVARGEALDLLIATLERPRPVSYQAEIAAMCGPHRPPPSIVSGRPYLPPYV